MPDSPHCDVHPSPRARLARSLRFARRIRGHFPLARRVLGVRDGQAFRVHNAEGWFEGSLDSVVDEQLYLTGGYEEPLIGPFLELFPQGSDVVLDIGANVGTHSLAFARHFREVIAFEPSPDVFAKLERNLALNLGVPVKPVALGLGDADGARAFYNVAHKGGMLGTFLQSDQYDEPLGVVGNLPIARGDDVLPGLIRSDRKIDAIKIDVQGFEPQALRGLRATLERHRPKVWIELGRGTDRRDFEALFPWPFDLLKFETGRRFGLARTWLTPVASAEGFIGDAVVIPRAA